MKKFFITVVIGYGMIAGLVFVTAQLGRRGKGGEKDAAGVEAQKTGPEEKDGIRGGMGERGKKGPIKAAESAEEMTRKLADKTFRTAFKNGRVSSVWTFREGLLDGLVVLYHDNGKTWMEMPYQKGLLNGIVRVWRPDGSLLSESGYAGGEPDGVSRTYYGPDTVWMQSEQPGSLPLLYSENGELHSGIAKIAGGPAPEKGQGVFRVLSREGEVKAEVNYGSGGNESRIRTYYADGTISSEWHVKDGLPEGTVLTWYPGGQAWQERVYSAGLLNGISREYDEEGALRRETAYSQGRRNGPARFFYADGTLWIEMTFENGRMSELPRAYSQGKSGSRIPVS